MEIFSCQRTGPIACDRPPRLLGLRRIDARPTMPTPAIQTTRWTRQEYDRMAEAGLFDPKERVQLIAGELVILTAQNSPHAVTIGKTQRVLERIFGQGIWVRIQMPALIDPDSEPEPDLVVVTGAPDEYLNEHSRTALLVIEVADTTLSLDRDQKAPLYARAGIPEYWIVNLLERCLEVFRDPVTPPGQPASYRSHVKLGPSDTISLLAAPTASIAVADLLP
ncbi:MAG: Uma2 family endonuclease [Candidatus Caldarchaeum sp.]